MKKDVIIVGSGAGGATVARELAMKGKSVAILEWGKDNPPNGGFFAHPLRFFGGMQNKTKAFLKSSDEPFMEIVRCITTGGGTLAYGGVSWDPPYDLFKRFGIDIVKEVEEIKNEITIKPLEANQMGPAAQLINKSALELEIKWEKLDRFFLSAEKFKQTSYLFGDKTGARWDARQWVIDAVDSGATLFNETFCEEVLIENGKAVGVAALGKDGKKIKIMSDVVVVAAGGIGSPKILNRANIKAGHDIFVDPYFVATGYLDHDLSDEEVTRQAGILLKEDGLALGDSALPAPAYRKLVLTHKKLNKLFKRKKALSILVEIDDDLSGSVDSEYKIVKPLSRKDLKKLEKGKGIARKILENAGAKDIWFTRIAGVHPGGTCKIGKVVDSNLQTSVNNLYVCDASVIPESMAIPPVLTILALAKRLSNHIA